MAPSASVSAASQAGGVVAGARAAPAALLVGPGSGLGTTAAAGSGAVMASAPGLAPVVAVARPMATPPRPTASSTTRATISSSRIRCEPLEVHRSTSLWGAETRIRVVSRGSVPSVDALHALLFMLWLTVRLLTRLLVFSEADDHTKDLEILVLRQQLRVLRRKTGRPQVHRTRPGPARRRQPRPPPTAMGIVVSRHAPDAAALAPHAGPAEVDLRQGQGAHAWQATDRPADHRAHPSDGQGERPLGPPADLRGASQARDPGGRHDHQDAAATTRPGPGAKTMRADLD